MIIIVRFTSFGCEGVKVCRALVLPTFIIMSHCQIIIWTFYQKACVCVQNNIESSLNASQLMLLHIFVLQNCTKMEVSVVLSHQNALYQRCRHERPVESWS